MRSRLVPTLVPLTLLLVACGAEPESSVPPLVAPPDEPEGNADPAHESITLVRDLAAATTTAYGDVGPLGVVEHAPTYGTLGLDRARVEVDNTTAFPQRAVVKLVITFPSGDTGGCSGTIVGARSVLTAGHCVHQPDQGGWASEVWAYPGLDGGYLPFDDAAAVHLTSVAAYIDDRDRDHDYALVTLDRPIGDVVGTFGMFAAGSSTLESSGLVMDGYPGQSYDGWTPIRATGSGENTSTNMAYYSLESEDGYSGSGVRLSTMATYVSAVNTRSDCYRFPLITSRACGPRITSSRLSRIVGWMTDHSTWPIVVGDQTGWGSLGGRTFTTPAAVPSAPGTIDLLTRASDGTVMRQQRTAAGAFTGWVSLGGTDSPAGARTGAVAAVSRAAGQLDLFILGSDGAVWTKAVSGGWPGTPWPAGATWSSLGGHSPDAPAAATWGANRLDVFVRGDNGRLYWNRWTGSWSGWSSLGGPVLTGAPTALSWGPNRIDVVGRRASDGALVWWRCSGTCTATTSWSAAQVIAGAVFPAEVRPTLVSTATGRLDVLVRGYPGDVWRAGLTSDVWGPWQSLGGVILDDVAATARSGRAELFVRGSDSNVYTGVIDANGGFAGWWWIGGNTLGTPAALSTSSSSIDVFMRDDYNVPRTRRWTASGGW